jgi:hypothetical protein
MCIIGQRSCSCDKRIYCRCYFSVLVETSTSDDLEEWSAWQAVGTSGELQSPNRQYIRFRVTLTSSDPLRTPKLLEIQLHDIPKAPYEN